MEAPFDPFDADSLRFEPHILFRRSTDQESLAFGALSTFERNSPENGLLLLEKYLTKVDKKVFGHISYELKDGIENLESLGSDAIGFPIIAFFEPENVFVRTIGNHWIHEAGNAPFRDSKSNEYELPAMPELKARTNHSEYLATLKLVQEHLKRGDIYELNYCIEHSAQAQIDPFELFLFLDSRIRAPHAAFYRNGNHFAICMSPEGFLRAENGVVTTKPMKGTRPRASDADIDEDLRLELLNDEKERAENIMAVDVARNDLSRIAEKESVVVKALCEVKTFSNVHQMISEVQAKMRSDMNHVDLLRATFPMASMTGAPKISAMKLIEQFEDMRRGIYSGCIGSLDLETHLDMNVVIRTIEYNSATNAISLKTGGAITALSIPESEYAEMLLKAASVTDHLKDV